MLSDQELAQYVESLVQHIAAQGGTGISANGVVRQLGAQLGLDLSPKAQLIRSVLVALLGPATAPALDPAASRKDPFDPATAGGGGGGGGARGEAPAQQLPFSTSAAASSAPAPSPAVPHFFPQQHQYQHQMQSLLSAKQQYQHQQHQRSGAPPSPFEATYPVGGAYVPAFTGVPVQLVPSFGESSARACPARYTSQSIAGLRKAVPHPVGLAGPTATYFDGNSGPLTGTGMEEIPHSGSALLDFNIRETNAGLTVPEPDRDPYSTGDTSCPSTAADTGSSSLDQEVNAEAGLPQSGSGGCALTEAPVRASCKRKKLVCGSSSQRSTSEFDLVELMHVLVQSDPSSDDIKPPAGSTDLEIIHFLRSEGISKPHRTEVNLRLGEQDQMAPKAVRSYVTSKQMISDQKTHLGYWKEKRVELLRDDEASGRFWLEWMYYGLKRTFQFHRYDGTKTNWFMHEYIPTNRWGTDLFMERLRFRVVYKGAEIPVPGEPTSPQVAAVKHRLRGPDDPKVVKGESRAWQHFIKIYDKHPELQGSKVVYAVCCHCEGVLKAGTENGTKSLLTHCDRTCPVKNKNQQPRSSRE